VSEPSADGRYLSTWLRTALFAFLAGVSCLPARADVIPTQPFEVNPSERLLVLAPHPDDEMLSSAGLMQGVLDRQGSVHVVIVTAGDAFVDAVEKETGKLHPRPADYVRYGELRLKEARRAADALGGGRVRLDLLGFPDGGLHPLLLKHWDRRHMETSPTTGQNHVSYPEAARPGVPFDGIDLQRELVKIMREEKPTLIVFPDAMDWHPDHDGLGMFALLAIEQWLESERGSEAKSQQPRMLSYLIHWYHRWPFGSDGLNPLDLSSEPLELPEDLPARGHQRTCYALTPSQRQTKRQMLAIYQTQQRIMAPFLSAFVRSTECFSMLKRLDAEHVETLMSHAHHAH
jgi:LmbE family N-acetylglucosaminyl deacetylase